MKAENKVKIKPNTKSSGGNIGSKSHKTQGNSYVQGDPQATYGPYEDVSGVRDDTMKAPYGKKGMGWAENSGKLGDLDPQEKDQPSWVGTWSKHTQGKFGVGPTIDENYYIQRPRTFSRQDEAFREHNPEFQDVANEGDWTTYKWIKDV